MCRTDLGKTPDGRRARGETTTQPGAVLTAEKGQAGNGGSENVRCLFLNSWYKIRVELFLLSADDMCISI